MKRPILRLFRFALPLLAACSLPTAAAERPNADRLVVLTFDDACLSHATNVAPLLKRYGFGATFFVGEYPGFEDKTKYMSWEQIRALHEQGFEVGNHTLTHAHADRLSRERFEAELEAIERRCLSNGIPKPVSFAYPAYATTPAAPAWLEGKGYQFARVGGSRPYRPGVDHPMFIPSFSTSGTNRARVLAALEQARKGQVVVLTVHGVPDLAHPHVDTPAVLFAEYMEFLRAGGYTVIALRDLPRHVGDAAHRGILPAKTTGKSVEPAVMQRVYETVKTPHKFGVVIRGEEGRYVDCPAVFRHSDKWWMTYIAFDGSGYETRLAESADLLAWKPAGKILQRGSQRWDQEQVAGFIALQNPRWEGDWTLEAHEGKYWLSYLGGRLKGYETPPLSVGLAWTANPAAAAEWTRLPENPVLTPAQPDARSFEKDTLFKSHALRDPESSLGWPYVMFYNARQQGPGIERIGMAVSRDLVRWHRYGQAPIIENGAPGGISGDPQVVRIGDVWVMFYFGAFWRPGAFDTFACSYDLARWTKWTGPDLIAPSEPWDRQYAHKPWVVRHEGVVYHYYCAVGDQGRVIALATSRPLAE